MKRVVLIGLLMLVALLPGCRRTLPAEEAVPSLSIAVDFPQSFYSKAPAELEADELEKLENKIYSLQVWLYRSDDNHEFVGSLNLTESDFPQGGGVKWYEIPNVGWSFVNEHPDVDVFALANVAAIGLDSPGEQPDYGDLENLVFGYNQPTGQDFFGLTSGKIIHSMDDCPNGLPMSACKKGVKVQGVSPQLKVESVKLQRLVSRIRMVCCKTKTEGTDVNGEVSISSIILEPRQIPLLEKVFAEGEDGTACAPLFNPELGARENNYVDNAYEVLWPANTTIGEHEAPESLLSLSQTPAAYHEALKQAIKDGKVTDLGYTYFRESDLALMGRVNYKVNVNTEDEKPRWREFSMPAKGDFARNHSWTLFAYFLAGRNLQIKLVASPWQKSDYVINYSNQSVTVTSKFVVDEDSADISYNADEDIYEVKLISGKPAKCHLHITTPVGGTLLIHPDGAGSLFKITPAQPSIDPAWENGRIDIEITNNPDIEVNIDDLPSEETTMTLSFSVEAPGNREINANSEIIDNKYRFHL